MELLLEVIKSNAYFAKEYKAENYAEGFEMTIDFPQCSRRVIDYIVFVQDGRKYWKENGRAEFVHSSLFLGEWRECKNGWEHTDEELIAMTRIPK